MKDVIVTVACVVILAAAGYFGTNFIVGHQQIAALPPAPPLPAKVAENATATEVADYKAAVKVVDDKNDSIRQQQITDANSRYKDSIIGGIVGIVIGIGVGVLVANTLSKKKAAQ